MEIYIAKGEKEVLTRVSLQINDNNNYIVESPYSDSDLRELAMYCVEAYLVTINISEEKRLETLKSIVMGDRVKYDKQLSSPTKIRMIFEQYDKREIVEVNSGLNIIEALVSAMKSCAVMATWGDDAVKDFLIGYLEERGVEIPYEENEDDNTCTVSIEA